MIPLAEIPYPDISPIIFELGPLKVRWYGLLYVMGFLVGQQLLVRLAKRDFLHAPPQAAADFVMAALIAAVLGARLVYVIFYDPWKFLADPVEVFRIWNGGLAFHGGLAGIMVVIWRFARAHKTPFLNFLDACALSGPPGILFVRIANFINGELWGRETDVGWGMRFPNGGDVVRHPSQLYEGFGEGVLLFCALWLLKGSRLAPFRGQLSAAFLIGYGAIRFIVEYFRQPDEQLGLLFLDLSMGQLLSSAMIVAGIGLWIFSRRLAIPVGPRPAADRAAAQA